MLGRSAFLNYSGCALFVYTTNHTTLPMMLQKVGRKFARLRNKQYLCNINPDMWNIIHKANAGGITEGYTLVLPPLHLWYGYEIEGTFPPLPHS